MALTQAGYRGRLIDDILKKDLQSFGAVYILGPKWCGKTWSARNQCNSEIQLTPDIISLLNIDRKYALIGDSPRLIDEWQEIPELWDDVRFDVDRNSSFGRFVLCGSSSADRSKVRHTGAGRIGEIRMRTMSLYETGDSDGSVSLARLFNGGFANTPIKPISLEMLIDYCVRGGWPKLVGSSANPARVITDYISKICDEDCRKIDGKKRNSRKMRLLIRSLARNQLTIVSDSRIQADIREYDDEDIGESTVQDYKAVLERLCILEYLESFSPNVRSSVRVGKTPKKYLSDPSLAVSALEMTRTGLLSDLNTFGFIFESLCIHDLRIYAEYLGGRVSHYRDNNGLEVDLIVELPDNKWGAFEIKLGTNQVDDAAKSLLKFDSLIEDPLRKPSVLAIICGNSPIAYCRADGVYVIPLTSLKP